MVDPATKQKVPSSAALAKHMLFVCPECGTTSNTHQEWRKHLNDIHGFGNKTIEGLDFKEIDRKYHECQICLNRIANGHQYPILLQYHRITHMPYSPYRCRYCPASYAKKRTLSVHIFRFHRRLINSLERQRMDPKYNKEFFMRYICPQCGKLFEVSAEWEKHIDKAHLSTSTNIAMHRIDGTNDYYCDQCSHTIKNSPSWNELRSHHFSHLPEPEFFQCAFCTTRRSQKSKLFTHFLAMHKDKYFQNEKNMCRPIEWGAKVQRPKDATKPKSGRKPRDILEKALVRSSIDFKQTESSENGQCISNLTILNKLEDLKDEELEQIYQEIFEEITDVIDLPKNVYNKHVRGMSDQDINVTQEFSEQLRKEMLKYINYLCPICLREFANQPAWRSHVFDQHNLANDVKTKFQALNVNKTAFVCLVCHQIQRTSKHTDLQRHHFQHMPYQDYLKCTICMVAKASKTKMFHHMKYIHRIQVECDEDEDAATDSNDDCVKDQVCSQFNNLTCLECDEVFSNNLLLQQHYKTCPSRLAPIAVGQYDIAKNKILLKHLQEVSQRLDCKLMKEGIEPKNIKLNCK